MLLNSYDVIAKQRSKYYQYYIFKEKSKYYFAKQQINMDRVHAEMLENEIEKYNKLKNDCILPNIYYYDLKRSKIIIYEYLKKQAKSDLLNLDFNEKIKILIKICEKIEIMHSKNIVHCDLKPDNIIILKNKVRIIDMGNSRYIGETTDYGNLKYSSYLQLKREKVSTFFDIYPMGIIIYEVISNEKAFENKKTEEIITLKKNNYIHKIDVKNNDMFNKKINKILCRCCVNTPEIRYQNIKELINDLVALLLIIS